MELRSLTKRSRRKSYSRDTLDPFSLQLVCSAPLLPPDEYRLKSSHSDYCPYLRVIHDPVYVDSNLDESRYWHGKFIKEQDKSREKEMLGQRSHNSNNKLLRCSTLSLFGQTQSAELDANEWWSDCSTHSDLTSSQDMDNSDSRNSMETMDERPVENRNNNNRLEKKRVPRTFSVKLLALPKRDLVASMHKREEEKAARLLQKNLIKNHHEHVPEKPLDQFNQHCEQILKPEESKISNVSDEFDSIIAGSSVIKRLPKKKSLGTKSRIRPPQLKPGLLSYTPIKRSSAKVEDSPVSPSSTVSLDSMNIEIHFENNEFKKEDIDEYNIFMKKRLEIDSIFSLPHMVKRYKKHKKLAERQRASWEEIRLENELKRERCGSSSSTLSALTEAPSSANGRRESGGGIFKNSTGNGSRSGKKKVSIKDPSHISLNTSLQTSQCGNATSDYSNYCNDAPIETLAVARSLRTPGTPHKTESTGSFATTSRLCVSRENGQTSNEGNSNALEYDNGIKSSTCSASSSRPGSRGELRYTDSDDKSGSPDSSLCSTSTSRSGSQELRRTLSFSCLKVEKDSEVASSEIFLKPKSRTFPSEEIKRSFSRSSLRSFRRQAAASLNENASEHVEQIRKSFKEHGHINPERLARATLLPKDRDLSSYKRHLRKPDKLMFHHEVVLKAAELIADRNARLEVLRQEEEDEKRHQDLLRQIRQEEENAMPAVVHQSVNKEVVDCSFINIVAAVESWNDRYVSSRTRKRSLNLRRLSKITNMVAKLDITAEEMADKIGEVGTKLELSSKDMVKRLGRSKSDLTEKVGSIMDLRLHCDTGRDGWGGSKFDLIPKHDEIDSRWHSSNSDENSDGLCSEVKAVHDISPMCPRPILTLKQLSNLKKKRGASLRDLLTLNDPCKRL